jgi:flagellar L-ring protein FlgH
MSESSGLVRTLLAALAMSSPLAQSVAQESASPQLYRSLYADRRAFRPGDLLTVLIVETAVASATARTRADKSDSVFAFLNTPDDAPRRWEGGLGSDFSGGGEIQRSGRLVAKLAVYVVSIDANGNMLVSGEQDIRVNDEEQRMALSGIVRPEDIAPDNTIVSWRISNAQIDFKGRGILARKQSPGLLSWLFDLFGLN